MSLVAYDQSDDSNDGYEEEKVSSQPEIPISACIKRKEGVKITIPSLKEFEDEECPVVSKKPKIQSSSSGLFSMLPPPKNTSTLTKPGFVPYVLSSKKAPAKPAPSKLGTKLTKNEAPKTTAPDVLDEQNSDEEASHNDASNNSHDTLSRDFFSLDSVNSESKFNGKDYLQQDSHTDRSLSPVQSDAFNQKSTLPELPTSTTYSDAQQSFMNYPEEPSSAQQDSRIIDYTSSNVSAYSTESVPNSYMLYPTEPVVEPDLKESLLKDKEFLKLQGRRREFEAADIIDVNASDQLTDKNEWLMKSLTEESTHRPSRKKCNMPTQQQKRKHQITYLAFQAKEREMDLKNQWAMNSRTRRETQAKYGF